MEGLSEKIRFFSLTFSLLIFINSCNLLPQGHILKDNLIVWFVDVDQGDASVVLTAEGKAFLIDTGNDSAKIVNFLSNNNLDTIQAVLLTHADLDHFGAFKAIIDNFHIKRVILPKDSSKTSEWRELLSVLQEKELTYYLTKILL